MNDWNGLPYLTILNLAHEGKITDQEAAENLRALRQWVIDLGTRTTAPTEDGKPRVARGLGRVLDAMFPSGYDTGGPGFQSTRKAFKNFARGVSDGVKDTLRGISDGARDTLRGVSDGARDTLRGISDGAKDTLKGVSDGARDTLRGVSDGVRDTLKDIPDFDIKR